MDAESTAIFERIVSSRAGDDNDPQFWTVALETFLRDIDMFENAKCRKYETFLQLGACSHWARPHASRWTPKGVASSFAWPSGYLDGQFLGRPEIDKFLLLHWDWQAQDWRFQWDWSGPDGCQVRPKFFGKHKLIFRATLPTRTLRHQQAAVHTEWTPGSPQQPAQKVRRFYGFQRIGATWECVAVNTWREGNKGRRPEESWAQ